MRSRWVEADRDALHAPDDTPKRFKKLSIACGFFRLRPICCAPPIRSTGGRRRSFARKPFSRWDSRLPNQSSAVAKRAHPTGRRTPCVLMTRWHFVPITRGWGSQSSDGVGTVVVAGWITPAEWKRSMVDETEESWPFPS